MKRFFKYSFYVYVFALVVYFAMRTIAHARFGRPQVAFEQPSQRCYQGGQDWNYCVYTNSKTDERAHLYVFHGLGEDENIWLKKHTYSALLQKYWQDQNYRTPKVITISFGSMWIVSPKLSHQKTGLLERFENEVLRKIESEQGAPYKRMLLGESMGGVNVLSLILHKPQYFSHVASLCPPLYSMPPHSGALKVFNFLRRTGAKPYALFKALGFGRYLFTSDDEWRKFSPLQLIQTKRLRRFPKLYLTTGLNDEFGNYEGVESFAHLAKKKGVDLQWRPNSGDHCAIDIPSLAEFLKI